MFEAIFLLYSWLPSPLNILASGIFALTLVFVVVRLIAFLWDLLPFT